jgi:hypothetical protein
LLVGAPPNLLRTRKAREVTGLNTLVESKQLMERATPAPDNASQIAESYRERAQISESLEVSPRATAAAQPAQALPMAGPMIARTASVSVIVKDFGPVEATVKAIAQRYNGYIASLNTASPQDAARTLSATLQIPSAQLESAVTELKQLGRVDQETQAGEEVTKEFTDRAARRAAIVGCPSRAHRKSEGHSRGRTRNRASSRRNRTDGGRPAGVANAD